MEQTDWQVGKKAAKPAHAKEDSAPRAESKGAKILEMIGRSKGATLAEIVKATDWQAHSVRGFLSTAAKKHGLKIESTKTEAGDRVYQIRKQDFRIAAAAREGGGFFCGSAIRLSWTHRRIILSAYLPAV